MRLPTFRSLCIVSLLVLAPLLGGCDQLVEVLELPNPAKDAVRADAESRAIGSACRHAGRSLEDCYAINGSAAKASVFAGWRDMNDYMMEHGLETVPSHLGPAKSPPATATSSPTEAAPAPSGGVPPVHSPLAGR